MLCSERIPTFRAPARSYDAERGTLASTCSMGKTCMFSLCGPLLRLDVLFALPRANFLSLPHLPSYMDSGGLLKESADIERSEMQRAGPLNTLLRNLN